ncbi:MAG: sulfite exporter TauE/SafE family protein [Candidatus Omnitrophota bacterium]|nr:sulfite exporter TauE/SafE family protein [Candidatus Omnitrophota bacterium]
MLRICVSLFLSGIFLGSGPCLVSCGPFLVSFIAGANKNLKESFRIWLIFSLARIFSYLLLGFIAGVFSQEIVYKIYQSNLGRYLLIAGGVFLLLIGILMMAGGLGRNKFCQALEARFIKKGMKSVAIFGLLIGFLPCAPLLAILSYIALISGSWYKGIWYSLSFGIGTLISPLIILAILASQVSKLLNKTKFFAVFQKICGLIIFVLGWELIIRATG